MANIQSTVAAHKQANPRLYCPYTRCLWRTGGGFCPRHTPIGGVEEPYPFTEVAYEDEWIHDSLIPPRETGRF
jgi:hypothetical protein